MILPLFLSRTSVLKTGISDEEISLDSTSVEEGSSLDSESAEEGSLLDSVSEEEGSLCGSIEEIGSSSLDMEEDGSGIEASLVELSLSVTMVRVDSSSVEDEVGKEASLESEEEIVLFGRKPHESKRKEIATGTNAFFIER